MSDCYKKLIGIARKANNAPLMERTYESYIVWTDSVKALTAQDELNVLKRKYDESQLTIQEKDDTLSAKQYIIIGLVCSCSHPRSRTGNTGRHITEIYRRQPQIKEKCEDCQ